MPEQLSAEHRALRDRVQRFLDEHVLEEASTETAESVDKESARELHRLSREAGLWSLAQPAEHGGQAAGPLALTVVRETLAASNSPRAEHVLGPDPGLIAHTEGALREELLPAVLRGDKRGAFAFTEPRDAPRPTSARREDGDLVIDGRKSYVTGGGSADFYTVLVRVEDSSDEPDGTAMVVVDRDTPGMSVEREFHSLEGGSHVSLLFEEARVPSSHVIGRVGEGMPRALRSIENVRLALSARATGWGLWVVDYLTAKLQEPHRSGSPLADHESIRLRYADIRISLYAARSMLYRTARLLDAGESVTAEIMATKIFATETIGDIVDSAVQLVGGQALVVGHPLESLYRRARSLRLTEGANDLLRLHVARGTFELGKGRV